MLESAFYPTSGGQMHDTGSVVIDSMNYKVVQVEKVGKVVMHFLDNDLPESIAHYQNLPI